MDWNLKSVLKSWAISLTSSGRKLDEKLRGFLVLSDLTKSDSSGSVSVRLSHLRWSGQTYAQPWWRAVYGSFSSGGFSCSLLGTGHFESVD